MLHISASDLRATVDYDPATGIFCWRVTRCNRAIAGNRAGYISAAGYRVICIDDVRHPEHRLAWLYIHDEWQELLDHINGDRADNRIANLRPATPNQNSWNSKVARDNTSGFKGVSFHKASGLWRASIGAHKKRISLGYYKTAEEASAAYRAGAIKYHGEFARPE